MTRLLIICTYNNFSSLIICLEAPLARFFNFYEYLIMSED